MKLKFSTTFKYQSALQYVPICLNQKPMDNAIDREPKSY